MTAALANDLRTYAVKRWPTMNHEWRKAKLASMLNMKVRRVRSYWDAEENMSPRLSEVEAIKALIKSKEAADDADDALARRIADLEAQVAILAAAIAREALASSRPETHQSSDGGTGESQGMPRRRSTD